MSATMAPADLATQLFGIVGPEAVSTARAAEFAIDGVSPAAVVEPESSAQVVELLKFANAEDVVLVPWGGGTKQASGHSPERYDVALRTTKLNKVLHYDPGDLTVTFGAGTSVAEIQATLAAHNQFLPLDVKNPARASIGGVLATNAHGPMKTGFGGVRDYCIGIEFVTGDGKLAKGGGRVVKNVAGYDLMKLMIGSYGTLGVITSASFKVFPRPQQTRTFIAEFAELREAVSFRDAVFKSPLSPLCVEMISPRAEEYLQEARVARDPDHHSPKGSISLTHSWRVAVRAAGSDAVLARYKKELGGAVSRELSGGEESRFWDYISNFEDSVLRLHHNAMIVHVHAPITSVEAACGAVESAATEQDCLAAIVGRAAGALVAAVTPIAVSPPSAMQYAKVASAIRAALPKDCSAMVVQCPKEAKTYFDVWGTSPNDMRIMKEIRAALDPKQVLNRGRFIVA